MNKRDLRRLYLIQRMELDASQWGELSASVMHQFSQMSLPELNFVLSYYPFEDRKEFDVRSCERILELRDASTQICWPKIGIDENIMEAHVVGNEKFFVKNRFNILEPLDGELVDPSKIDLVFVPLIAFDRKGFRVGYGKGYYDRYLARCRADVYRVGFSFFEPVDEISDIDEFDISLSHCITPTRIYEF